MEATEAKPVDAFAGRDGSSAGASRVGFFEGLKKAATSRDGKISAACAAAMIGAALIPGVGETALMIQISTMFTSGLGMSLFGRVALEDAFKAPTTPPTAAPSA